MLFQLLTFFPMIFISAFVILTLTALQKKKENLPGGLLPADTCRFVDQLL